MGKREDSVVIFLNGLLSLKFRVSKMQILEKKLEVTRQFVTKYRLGLAPSLWPDSWAFRFFNVHHISCFIGLGAVFWRRNFVSKKATSCRTKVRTAPGIVLESS